MVVSTSGGGGVVVVAALALVALRLVLSYKSAVYAVRRLWRWADEWAQAYQYHEVPRLVGSDGVENLLFRKAAAYVSSLPSLEDADAACVVLSSSSSRSIVGRTNGGLSLQLGPGHTARDAFLGARLAWTLHEERERGLVLRVRRHDRTRVLRPYLQHVESVADEIMMEQTRRRELIRTFVLVSNKNNTSSSSSSGCSWASAPFTHPATLDTVAMDPDLKARVRADLESFLKGRAYYHRLGRVWRRSYLLYGPPGTGKSTFAAAMARFLGYDINLASLSLSASSSGDVDLRELLLRTTPRSLILVEHLDRYLHHQGQGSSAGAQMLMSFMDGLSSCCGEERVMVFTMTTTTTTTDKLDVLRPGRLLDVHIHFPLCDFQAFKALATTYLGLKDHRLYPQLEEAFLSAGSNRLSHAELGEIMLANRASPTRALRNVITKLNHEHRHRRNNSFSTWSAEPPARRASADDGTNTEPGVIGGNKEDAAPMREIKKLYGLIKIRSRREGPGVIPFQVPPRRRGPTSSIDKDR